MTVCRFFFAVHTSYSYFLPWLPGSESRGSGRSYPAGDCRDDKNYPPPRRIKRVTSCRKKPNGGAQPPYSADSPFGFFRQLVTLLMQQGEVVFVITSITCWIGTPTPAGFTTRKPGKKIAVRSMYSKKKTAYCHCRESAQCNVRK